MRSGKNPLGQIVKRLSESSALHHISSSADSEAAVALKKPNNAFILSDSSCCEVVEVGCNDERGNKRFVCRLYERTEPLFVTPCDSRLIGVHKANQRWTSMKVLPPDVLHKKALKVDLGPTKILFMALLHTN